MDRYRFLEQLANYQPFDHEEEAMHERMVRFVERNADCFQRSLLEGHITSSCWVIDPERTATLLCWHKRLNRWLQMGGHVEDDPSLLASAARELREESGLTRVRPLSEAIFDLDVHLIPERGAEPEHLHYDVRFRFEADPAEPLTLSPESRELAWVRLPEVHALNDEASMRRMVAKTREASARRGIP